ncbi:MAG TPA: hypothetical protein VFD48_08665 [Pyrinomonadaceae bacterium]|nr:hypothetical protein [Pyrinomonadaceae bacterium]
MPKTTKAAKKRTKTKALSPKKKSMSAKEMKKVKGGITNTSSYDIKKIEGTGA